MNVIFRNPTLRPLPSSHKASSFDNFQKLKKSPNPVTLAECETSTLAVPPPPLHLLFMVFNLQKVSFIFRDSSCTYNVPPVRANQNKCILLGGTFALAPPLNAKMKDYSLPKKPFWELTFANNKCFFVPNLQIFLVYLQNMRWSDIQLSLLAEDPHLRL